mgnify:CR=1 FL=1
MRMAVAIAPAAGPRGPRRGSRRRMLRDGLPAAGSLPGLEGAARDGVVDRATCDRSRRRARAHPRGDRRSTRSSRPAFRPTTSSTRSASSRTCVATARAHSDLAARLDELVEATTRRRSACWSTAISARRTCLIGPAGPVILDAECAWYGDPAFDLAFVLNHLLLKGAWRPQWRDALRRRARRAACGATSRASTGSRARAATRATAALLPGSCCARIDGKSPVEYLTDDATRDSGAARSRARLLHERPSADARRNRAPVVRVARRDERRDRPHRSAPRLGLARAPDASRPRSRLASGAVGPRDRAGRRVARLARGDRPARRRQRASAARRGDGGRQRRRRRSRGARRRATRSTRPAIDAALIALDGTPNKARLGGNATVAVSLARRARRRGARARCRCGAISPATRPVVAAAAGDPDLRRRRACRAADRHPGPHGRAARRARRFAEALRMDGRGLPRGRRADERAPAARQASPTKAAGGRRSTATRQALDDARRARSSAPASCRATRSRSRSTSPRPSSAATAATALGLERARARPRRHDRAAARLARPLSRSSRSRIRSPRTTRDGWIAFTRGRRHRASRSSATIS